MSAENPYQFSTICLNYFYQIRLRVYLCLVLNHFEFKEQIHIHANLSHEPFAYLKNKLEIRLVQKTLYSHSIIYKFLRKSSTIILSAKGNENYTFFLSQNESEIIFTTFG